MSDETVHKVDVNAKRGPALEVVTPAEPSAVIPGAPMLDAALIEQYEPVVAQVLFSGDRDRFCLAVTSAIAGEGVAATSAGLAMALARSTSSRVLLVDANLRDPQVHTLFNVDARNGLSETVTAVDRASKARKAGELPETVSAYVRPTAIGNLFVLTGGAALESPTPLMTSEALRATVRSLRERFGYVILACPPVLASVEAVSVCRLADGVVLVVRAGMTPREEVVSAQMRLVGAPLVGAVLYGA